MSTIDSNMLFEEIRTRMGLNQTQMAEKLGMEESTIWRTVSRETSPKGKTLKELAKLEPLTETTLVLPYLEDQPMSIFALCDGLTHALDTADVPLAERLIATLETSDGFDEPINQQFMLSQKARLGILKGAPSEGILQQLQEGLLISGTSEINFRERGLYLQEPELLHSLALLNARDGKTAHAIDILENVIAALDRSPFDDATKEQRLANKMLTLAKLRQEIGDHVGAIKSCDEGFDTTVKRNNGKHCPDFLLLKASALHSKGNADNNELYRMLIHSYSGFYALNKQNQAKNVLNLSRDRFSISLYLYGIDRLKFSRGHKRQYVQTDPVTHSGFNVLLYSFRKQSRFSREALYRGLCSMSTFTKLEGSSDTVASYYLIKSLTERMGRDIRHYQSFRVSSKVAKDINLRDKIQILCRQREYGEAGALLDELAKSKDYEKGPQLQYILKTRATIYGASNDKDPKYLDMLMKAIGVTLPEFKEGDIRNYPLTLDEATIINQMAFFYESTESVMRAVAIYGSLLENIESNWRDETLFSKLFATVSFNYSSTLGLLGQLKDSQMVIDKAIEFEQAHDRLRILPALFYNTAFNQLEADDCKEDSLALLALSYYNDDMLSAHGHKRHLETTLNLIRKHFSPQIALELSNYK